MKYLIKIDKEAQKTLRKIPRRYQVKILSILPILADNPFAGKKLRGEFEGTYSYRVSPYRIIYRIHKKKLIVIVLDIGHRQGIYN